jgi:hypothetical protein
MQDTTLTCAHLEHFQAKRIPVRVKKMLNKELEHFHVSTKHESAPELSPLHGEKAPSPLKTHILFAKPRPLLSDMLQESFNALEPDPIRLNRIGL